MKLLKGYIIVVMLIFSVLGYGQDPHFSQTDYAALNLNPALTGFERNLNLSLHYKNQWNPTQSPFKTYMASGDGVLNPKTRSPWKFAMGGMVLKDAAGTPQLNTHLVNTYFASQIDINRNNKLSAGLYLGVRQQSISEVDGEWASQYDGSGYDPTIQSGESFAQMGYLSFNSGLGVAYQYKSNARSSMQNNGKSVTIGLGVYNLNKPRNSFLEGQNARLSQRYSAFAKGQFGIYGSIVHLEPSVFYHRQSSFQEILYGMSIGFDLKKRSNYIGAMSNYELNFGLHHRWNDAIVASAQINIDKFIFGFSYDFNISDLQISSNLRGGTEFFLSYQINSR